MRKPVNLSALGLVALMAASCGMQAPATMGTDIDNQQGQQVNQQQPAQQDQQQPAQQDQQQPAQQDQQQPAQQDQQQTDQQQTQTDQQQAMVSGEQTTADSLLNQAEQAVDQGNIDQAIAHLNNIKAQIGNLGIQDQQKVAELNAAIDKAIQDITNAQVNRKEVASIAVSQLEGAIDNLQNGETTVQGQQDAGTSAEQPTTPTETQPSQAGTDQAGGQTDAQPTTNQPQDQGTPTDAPDQAQP